MHLMMDALSEDDDPVVRSALARGMAFISDKHDATDVGAWFYHDELETSEAGMRRAPFKWWPSTVLGKSPQNMLVLNTQLDTLVALERYGALTRDTQYAPLVESGYQAARAVLSLRPMEWLYRLVFSAIDLTLLPTEQAARLPVWKRLWKRIGWQMFIPRLPRLKTRFPRLVMPGGYIDRELSLQTWAYDYLAVNLMDLVRVARGPRRAAFMPYIDGILEFCARTGIVRRWLEHKGRAYAVGFYAESLVLLSLAAPRPAIDAMLADALQLCVHHGLGLPPSLNGGNAEAQTAHSSCTPARLCRYPRGESFPCRTRRLPGGECRAARHQTGCRAVCRARWLGDSCDRVAARWLGTNRAMTLRIGLITSEFPPDLGGVETYAWQLASELGRRPGLQVTVYAPPKSATVSPPPGVTIKPILQKLHRAGLAQAEKRVHRRLACSVRMPCLDRREKPADCGNGAWQ